MENKKRKSVYIDRILFPVTSLGPGKRLVIWVSGCLRRCEGCANPELWERHPFQQIDTEDFLNMLHAQIDLMDVDGITVSGGEPFDQAEELCELLGRIKQDRDLLVFSGYRIEDIQKDPVMKKLLNLTDVLIDGEYIDSKNDGISALRGSVNQRIHILDQGLTGKYDEYLKLGRQIQNFTYDYQTISVGIHNRDRGSEGL
ncbi:MAG: radical SAM protein [Lachnospiraceae bacterium]|nr:radical SAM protein [Lachnospiraceae bacterium]